MTTYATSSEALAGADALPESVCPFCGFEYDPDFLGVDLRGSYLDWTPCCEAMREAVGYYGFDGVFGVRLEAVASTISGRDVRGVSLDGDRGDSVYRCPLEVEDPGRPGDPDRVYVTSTPDGAVDVVDGVRTCRTARSGWRTEVFAEVAVHHRHHDAPQGHKFSVAVYNGPTRVGVAVVGRPVSRRLAEAEPLTLEVTRVCTWGESFIRRNASSKLYGAAVRRARSLGATKLVTYTLADEEDGASLKASGFVAVAETKGGSWDRPSRGRGEAAPTGRKVRWERRIGNAKKRR
jgi:hypothetical protein